MCKINFRGTILCGKLLLLRKILTFDGSEIVYKIEQKVCK